MKLFSTILALLMGCAPVLAAGPVDSGIANFTKSRVGEILKEYNNEAVITPGSFEIRRVATPSKFNNERLDFLEMIETYTINFTAFGGVGLAAGTSKVYCSKSEREIDQYVNAHNLQQNKKSQIGELSCWFGQTDIFSKAVLAIEQLLNLTSIDDTFVRRPERGVRVFRAVKADAGSVSFLGGFRGSLDCGVVSGISLSTAGFFSKAVGRFQFPNEEMCRSFAKIIPFVTNANPIDLVFEMENGQVRSYEVKSGRDANRVLLVFYSGPDEADHPSGKRQRWKSWDDNYTAFVTGSGLEIFRPGSLTSSQQFLARFSLSDQMREGFENLKEHDAAPFMVILNLQSARVERLKFVDQTRVDQIVSWE